MKIKLDKKYIQIGFTIFFTSIAILFVIFFIWNNASIRNTFSLLKKAMAPVLYGLIIAYLLTPILNYVERNWFIPLFHKLKWFEPEKDKKRKKHIRAFSLVTTLVIVLVLLYLFFATVIPQIVGSVQNIVMMYPRYSSNLLYWMNQLLEKNPELSELLGDLFTNFSTETDDWLKDSLLPMLQTWLPNMSDILKNLSSSVFGFLKFLWNIVIGLIISIYVRISKETFSQSCIRMCYAFFERKNANKFIDSVRFTHQTFIGFISGKIVDSLIIGFITFIVLTIMRMPYTILISVIIGVTNIIPFFGPWFGAIPCALILLMINPKLTLYFIIFIVILQQIDGNLIGPFILSQTTGVTTFWIITSITFFSGLFGLPGMILAVPVTGVLFAFVNEHTKDMLIKKNLPPEPEAYLSVGSIDEEGHISPYEVRKPKKPETKTEIFFKKLYLNTKFYFKDKKFRREENKKGKEE